MPSKIPIAAAIVGSIVVIGALLILVFYQGQDKVVLIGLYVTVIVAVFSYLQSATNTSKIAEVKETSDITHKIVNNELTEWKTSLKRQTAADVALVMEQMKVAVAEASAAGLAQGRALAVQEAKDTATTTATAIVSAAAPAESVTEAADKVIQVAAAAADKVAATATEAAAALAASGTPAAPAIDVEPGVDGVVRLKAPTTIEVKGTEAS
jgi:hypothetical protein